MSAEAQYGKFTKTQLDAFLAHPFLARLGTAAPARGAPDYPQPHVTPVWFVWDGTSLFISAFTSTRKVREVRGNPFIALLIDRDDPVDGMTAVLAEGRAEWINEPGFVQAMSRQIYTHYMGAEVEGPAPQSWIIDPENSIIKLTPARIYTW